ncbi:MAG TPA: DUF4238 domain-containing protein [Gammaproteobacteria bacterium]|nr:DUF4238 domain-containing protein [Gammaproteobacteria bacterium]
MILFKSSFITAQVQRLRAAFRQSNLSYVAMASSRHHFVPQAYLRGFSCPVHGKQFVWVYDKREGRAPTCKSVKSIAWAHNYYAQERDDGSTDSDRLEVGLAQTIDNRAAELVSSLDASDKNEFHLTDDNQAIMAIFVGLSLTRVPSFRDGINDFYTQIAQYMTEAIAPKLWKGEGPPPEVRAKAKEWVSLEHMIQGAQQIANSLMEKQWQFFRCPVDQPFITSDNPVVFHRLAPATASSEIFMHLKKDLAIVCTPKLPHGRFPILDASRAQVRSMNATLAQAARHRIFASYASDGLNRLAKKYADMEQRIAT